MIIYLILINAIALVLMLADKQFAVNKAWRIPEKVLLGAAFIGGSLGCLLGMKLFRHKTRKPRFSIGVPVILAIQAVAFVYYLA